MLRWISFALVSVGAIALAGLALGGYLGFVTAPPAVPLVLALVPGWFPVGIVIAVVLVDRSSRYVLINPIVVDDEVVLRAHPRFAESVAAQ
ncbi:hypothetical protein GCM10023318_51920 [Nocardia callitridis]|uniref:Uncharacterized protein n=1 Tax=Nocardia callitridis TaxID=648753 RepID=A0ABP9KVV9_9NOCA